MLSRASSSQLSARALLQLRVQPNSNSSICLQCRHSLAINPNSSFNSNSYYHNQASTSASSSNSSSSSAANAFLHRRRPAGLSLSQTVGKTSVEVSSDGKKKSTALLPTGGLNQRVANIPAKRLKREQDAARRKLLKVGATVSADSDSPSLPSSSGGKLAIKEGHKTPKTAKPKPEFKHLKMARSLSPLTKTQKSSLRETLKTGDLAGLTFEELPFSQESIPKAVVKDVLGDLDTVDPTPIQRLAIPRLLERDYTTHPVEAVPDRYLVAAETGSGKTLAYLLPLIDHLKRAEKHDKEVLERELAQAHSGDALFTPEDFLHPKVSPPPRPRAVILLPTAELVAQVGSIAKKLAHQVKFRTILLSRDCTPQRIRNQLDSQPDIIIATPHLLSSIAQEEPGILEKCGTIVADEADSLLDRSFEEITESIIVRAGNLQQLILCSATIPRGLDVRLRKKYPDIVRLVTPNLHAIPRRVQMSIVDTEGNPYRGNKMLACADVLYGIARDSGEEGFVKKVVVFVNERETTGALVKYLCGKGIEAVELTRDSESRRREVLEFFTGGKVADTSSPEPVSEDQEEEKKKKQLPKSRNKEKLPQVEKLAYTPPPQVTLSSSSPSRPPIPRMKVLVTTDIASRGIDTKTVKTVVLYDVPFSTVDFIHRIGRTGRMGRRGKAVVLVDAKTNRAWVKEVKLAMFMGSGLV